MQLIPVLSKATLLVAACGCGWSLANNLSADDIPLSSQSSIQVSAEVNPAPTVPAGTPKTKAEVPGFGTPALASALEAYRGGFENIKNDMQLNGSVANNSNVNVVTGNNIVSDGSFANASGLPMLIQNSGSNVLIQNATIVNVQFK